MNEKLFQEVFDLIADFLPEGWNKMIFYAGYSVGSYSMKFYSKTEKGKYIDCFSIPGASKAKLVKTFMEIDKVLSKSRKELGDSNAWTIFSMSVDCDGNMKTDFEYDDHSEDMIAYEKKWAEKYLN